MLRITDLDPLCSVNSVTGVGVISANMGYVYLFVTRRSSQKARGLMVQKEQAKDNFRYVAVGSLDEPSALPPKGEFFCSQREDWMPQIPGELARFLKR